MESAFTHLPSEVILHILQFVDNITVRHSISIVNKRFYELSQDLSLHRHYEVSQYDERARMASLDLTHDLYRTHVKVLIANVSDLRFLRDCSLPALQKLVLRSCRFDYLNSRDFGELVKSKPSITVKGVLNTNQIDNDIIPLLCKVETVVCNIEDLETAAKIPASSFVLRKSSIATEDFPLTFRGSEINHLDHKTFGIDLNSSFIYTQSVPDTKVGDLLKFRVVSLCSWSSNTQLLTALCRDLAVLEEIDWGFVGRHEIPVIEQLATRRLRKLKLGTLSSSEDYDEILSGCELLLTQVQDSLKLHRFELQRVHYFQRKFKKLSLSSCVLPIQAVLLLESSEVLRLNGSRLTGSSAVTSDRTICTGSLSVTCSSLNLTALLSVCHCTSITLHDLPDDELRMLLMKLTSFTTLEEFSYSSRVNIQIYALLDALLGSRHRLRSLRVKILSVVVDERVLQLLGNFPLMEFIHLGGQLHVSKKQFRQHYPTAFINVEKRNSMEHFGEVRLIISPGLPRDYT